MDGAVLAESPVGTGCGGTPGGLVAIDRPLGLLVYTGDKFPNWKLNIFVGSVRRG